MWYNISMGTINYKRVIITTTIGVIGLVPMMVYTEPMENEMDLTTVVTEYFVMSDYNKAILPQAVFNTASTSNNIGTLSII